MTILAEQLIKNIIRPTLKYFDLWSCERECLLAGTAAQETELNIFLPYQSEALKLGLYGISPEKHRHIWDTYLAFKPDLASKTRGLASQRAFLSNPENELVTNLTYATAIAWLIYEESGLSSDTYPSLRLQAKAWRKYFHPCNEEQEKHYCVNYHRLISASKQKHDKKFAA